MRRCRPASLLPGISEFPSRPGKMRPLNTSAFCAPQYWGAAGAEFAPEPGVHRTWKHDAKSEKTFQHLSAIVLPETALSDCGIVINVYSLLRPPTWTAVGITKLIVSRTLLVRRGPSRPARLGLRRGIRAQSSSRTD